MTKAYREVSQPILPREERRKYFTVSVLYLVIGLYEQKSTNGAEKGCEKTEGRGQCL